MLFRSLVLELSITQYVDSVFFEEVEANGRLIKTYGFAKVINNNSLYRQIASITKAGLTYFRAKIKLKSGAIVYTDIINVLTTGEKKILFYPNPASSKSGIQYVLQ